VSYNLSQVTGT